ncbi:MAG: LuxR C-terminal-related transcriptional regulator [Methylobacterium sp.]|jgi:DNA-binding NarL/FixJ family response regulator|uniref:response regulator transcription factor n=1 Tax=unclassified Methylobacterium TaxID=2615210 RepID=UPI0006F8CF4F|nr:MULTISPECIES: LuxR C-terminal-related transcriptional regulator [unclassified Methylobacterium]KQP10997.1 LuxR family transcriptional regulator [Methylobacterium sp. Leaf99]MDO9426912.1 LuxR C-terminal-related transcriptional regulator [Methylobacterium sp.]TXM74005.1 response regulator transcription factor [Methylobacterium sp. WL69]
MHQAVGVLIVDEPYGLEPTFRAVLEHEPALHTVSEADLIRGGPDMPGATVALVIVGAGDSGGGAARIERLRARCPGLKILAAFETLDAAASGRLVAAGADVFVARSACARVVCAAILALAGLPAAARTVDPTDGLTPREAEILRFLSAGFSNKEVARRLNLSVRTVETHRLNLRRKTQTGRLKDLVALARHLGLAPVTEADGAVSVRRAAGPSPAAFTAPAAL